MALEFIATIVLRMDWCQGREGSGLGDSDFRELWLFCGRLQPRKSRKAALPDPKS
jgi:hypothetical protein